MTRLMPDVIAPALRICGLVAALLIAGCADTAEIDNRECLSKGFKPGTRDYDYCRTKLQELREDEYERGRRIFDMIRE